MKKSSRKSSSPAPDRKKRGRSNITHVDPVAPTHPMNQQTKMTQVNRAVSSSGTSKHRGDRRDMSKTYTNNAHHATRGNSPRKDVSTRKR